jgi:hypothetical protein
VEIEGKNYGTSSITKGLARHRMAQGQKAKEASDKAGHPVMPNEGGGGGSVSNHDHGGEPGGHEVIQQVHDEHGPAHTVEVRKEGEHHTVKTTHEDGHEHTSKGHPTVEHVHGHIGASIGKGEEQAHQEPDGDESSGSLEAMGLGGKDSEQVS